MRYLCPHCRGVLTGEPGVEQECRLCHEKAPVPEHSTDADVVIGDFAIIRELGRGGVGIIFLARQLSLDRQVALKVLQKRFAENKEYIEGFFREARVAAQISHPNIVQAYAVGEEDGIYYFAMEYIDGCTMKQVLKQEGKVEPKRAAEIISAVADALDFAWTERQIVHQDIKPDNIMLTNRGMIKLADLGLARLASRDGNFDDEDEVMGTPQYISPEQLTGVPTDVRSDIYSLGATFYHLVTGQFPYNGKDGNEIARQHVYGTFVPPKEILPELPDELNRIITRMMEKSAEERYQSAAELRDELKRFLSGRIAAPKLNIAGLKNPQKSAPPKIAVPKSDSPKAAPPKMTVPAMSRPAPAPVAEEKTAEPEEKEPVPAVLPVTVPAAEAVSVPEPEKREESPAEPIQEDKSGTDMEFIPLPTAEEKAPARPAISRRKLLVIILVPVSLLVVTGLLAGGLFAALRYRKGPEKYRVRILEVLRLEQAEDGALSFKAPEKKPEVPAAPQPPPPPPKPKPRPEFISGVNMLMDALRNRMPEKEFLDKADAFFASYSAGPRTAEEATALAVLVEPFGRIDERLRMAPARKRLREEQVTRSNALKDEEERAKREAAEREALLKKQAEEQRIAAQKLAEEAAAAAKRQAEEQKRHFAEFQAKAAEERRLVAYDFIRIARTGDMLEWNGAAAAAESRVRSMFTADVREKKIQSELLSYIRSLKNEMPAAVRMKELYYSSGGIAKMTMELSGSRLANVVRLDGNTLVTAYKDSEFRLNILDANTRKAFLSRAERRFKVKNSSFYLSLINGDYQYVTAAAAPTAFLKKEINNLLRSFFAVAWSKADDNEKANMRKAYGKIAAFKGIDR